ncbi:MAG TPA: hypothetical protein VNK91_13080 [Burkholderiaceae bacterium]|nr:hypothetical protein [Burkholderiaceae bacterium]
MTHPAAKPSPGERAWRSVLFVLSAAMAALAAVDLDAGRLAGALGDSGVACLMLSLLPQFPFVRALVAASERPRPREELLRDLERVRPRNPWADRAGAAGWMLLASSFVLRVFGFE